VSATGVLGAAFLALSTANIDRRVVHHASHVGDRLTHGILVPEVHEPDEDIVNHVLGEIRTTCQLLSHLNKRGPVVDQHIEQGALLPRPADRRAARTPRDGSTGAPGIENRLRRYRCCRLLADQYLIPEFPPDVFTR